MPGTVPEAIDHVTGAVPAPTKKMPMLLEPPTSVLPLVLDPVAKPNISTVSTAPADCGGVLESVTETCTLPSPLNCGAPLNTPELLKVKPAARGWTVVQVSVPVPPVAANVVEYAWARVAGGKLVVETARRGAGGGAVVLDDPPPPHPMKPSSRHPTKSKRTLFIAYRPQAKKLLAGSAAATRQKCSPALASSWR